MSTTNKLSIYDLQLQAAQSRKQILRMCKAHSAGHLGGAFSCIDIVTALYFRVMKYDPQNPKWNERDRLILSAGHKALAQYASLCELGVFPDELLDTYGSLHCAMPGHPDMHKIPGIEGNTGALGHGLSLGCGMAIALRDQGFKSKVYIILGDGELAEGSNWEGAAIAAHYGLDNLVLVVDNNGLQIGGNVNEVMSFEPITDRFAGFGWNSELIDGHNMEETVSALEGVLKNGKPTAIVAKTIKGKGYSRAEGDASYHFWAPSDAEMKEAEEENAEMIARLKNG